MDNTPENVTPHSRTARLLAVEVLLDDLEALGDDVLESQKAVRNNLDSDG